MEELYDDYTVKHLVARESELEDACEMCVQFPLTLVVVLAPCSASPCVVPWGSKPGHLAVDGPRRERAGPRYTAWEHEARSGRWRSVPFRSVLSC